MRFEEQIKKINHLINKLDNKYHIIEDENSGKGKIKLDVYKVWLLKLKNSYIEYMIKYDDASLKVSSYTVHPNDEMFAIKLENEEFFYLDKNDYWQHIYLSDNINKTKLGLENMKFCVKIDNYLISNIEYRTTIHVDYFNQNCDSIGNIVIYDFDNREIVPYENFKQNYILRNENMYEVADELDKILKTQNIDNKTFELYHRKKPYIVELINNKIRYYEDFLDDDDNDDDDNHYEVTFESFNQILENVSIEFEKKLKILNLFINFFGNILIELNISKKVIAKTLPYIYTNKFSPFEMDV